MQNGDPTSPFNYANAGFAFNYQFINIKSGKEFCPTPHFFQNLEEAEFAVALYMYMCLKGYSPDKITILTTYNGQKYLIRDIIHQKCSWSTLFKKPSKVTTVDKFQGQQNDFIILSLVRSEYVGHMRDPRRMIVAFSRARLGLYVLGKFDIFEVYPEMKATFAQFKKLPLALHLCPEEKEQSKRASDAPVPENGVRVIQNNQDLYAEVQNLLKLTLSH